VSRLAATLALSLLLPPAAPARAQESEPKASPALGAVVLQGGLPERPPRLVLVLSGGGARGAAHIGVLHVLEELHIVPDLVVGTSMGSIVGGLYAAGWTPARIEQFLKEMDWNQTFTDRVPRTERSFHRKLDDRDYLMAAKLRFKGIKPYMPAGVLGGQRLDLMLKALEFGTTTERDFDRLPIPYRAVAADIATGQAIVMGEGSLSTAMRASMSISGVFPPVLLEGRQLVDGGAVANLPVGIAQKLGAARILAVDISSPLSEAEEIRSFFSIINQMSGLLTVGNVQADIQRLGPEDVYIRPELGDITFSSFERAGEAVGIGEAAARAQIDKLRALAATPEAWQALQARRAQQAPTVMVDEVRIDNRSWVDDEVVRRRLNIKPGMAADGPEVTAAVMQLLALDYFGTIACDYERVDGKGVLQVDVPQKPHGKAHLQFGLGVRTDWQESSRRDSARRSTPS
jgi:NTE family protein